jgi:hypothetical protein
VEVMRDVGAHDFRNVDILVEDVHRDLQTEKGHAPLARRSGENERAKRVITA